jgi:hypothetical protein
MAEPGGYESVGLRKAHITLIMSKLVALHTNQKSVSQENSFIFVQKLCHANNKSKYLLSDDSL